MTKRKAKTRSVTKNSSKEPARETVEFDREFVIDSFQAPTPQARAKWQKAKRKPGRPKRGKGAKVISVSVEKGLLARCDELARIKGLTRARLIARALRAVLVAEGLDEV